MSDSVKDLMFKRLNEMTGSEFVLLVQSAFRNRMSAKSADSTLINGREVVFGMRALAEKLYCSESRAYLLSKRCKMCDITVSSPSKEIAYDVEKARAAFQRICDEDKKKRRMKKNVVGYEAEG